MDKSQSPASLDVVKQRSPSMICRWIRTRQSAEQRRFWTKVCRLSPFEIGPTMILAIILCTSVFDVGKCDLELRERHERSSTIRVSDVSSLEFFDSNGIERGAATMGGRIKMTLRISPRCTSGNTVDLFDAAGNRLGEDACGDDRLVFDFKVIDQLTPGRFKIKMGEVESEPFESHIYYVLVKHPIENRCGETQVYAKVEAGSWNQKVTSIKCITPYPSWCREHYERSSKISCPAAPTERNSYCYGAGKSEGSRPLSETEKATGCEGTNSLRNPYISYDRHSFPNDGTIKMNKTQPTIIVYVPPGSTGKLRCKIDYLNDSKPFEGNETPFIAPQHVQGHYFFNVSLELFDEPFLAVLQINTTIDNDHVFYTRHDLVYLGTQTDLKVSIKSGTSTQYEATGELADLCKRVKNMVCGLKTEGQYHEGTIVTKPIFYYGFHTWSGELVINEVTPEIETSVTVATKMIPTDSGNGNTDDQPRCPATTPCAVCTTPTPNTTDKCECANKNSQKGQVVDHWIILLGSILALILEAYANRKACVSQ